MTRAGSETTALIGFDQDTDKPITTRQFIAWGMIESVYLSSIIFNIYSQSVHSWGKYAFELTQIGAWLSFFQHLAHPNSPVKNFILKPVTYCKFGHGRWQCIRSDNYTHRIGLSNLAITAEMLIPVLYWTFAFQFTHFAKPSEYANALLMHGAVSLAILIDYFAHLRPFHLLHNLCNITLFIAAYTAWNYIGQKVQAEPIYPLIDWEKQPQNAITVLAIACGSSLLLAAILKRLLYLTEKKCTSRVASTISFVKDPTPIVLTNYQSLSEQLTSVSINK